MKKRLFAILLALTLALSLLPVAVFATEVEDTVGTPEEPAVQSDEAGVAVQAAHTHCFCGGSVTAGDHNDHNNVGSYKACKTWSELKNSWVGKNPVAYAYLENDITADNVDKLYPYLSIQQGRTLYLCLNGHTLNLGDNYIWVGQAGATLYLCDCSAQKTGTVSGGSRGCVSVDDNIDYKATFNMYGGTLKGGNRTTGGGVDVVNGTMNMYGGTITENTATSDGGGIYVGTKGALNLYGGIITKNTVSTNEDHHGGGVYVESNKWSGVGKISISGSPVITGNTRTYTPDSTTTTENLYLSYGFTNSGDLPIITLGTLTSGANIGISTKKATAFSTASETDYSNYFFSDDTGYHVAYNAEKKLELKAGAAHVHSGGTATCTEKAVCTTCGKEYGSLDPENHSGSKQNGWSADDNEHWQVYSCCNAIVNKAAHNDGTATCADKAVCRTCGTRYGDIDPTNHVWLAWTSNGDGTHTRVCLNNRNNHKETVSCSGGTASCHTKAVCEVCNEAYGEFDATNHDGGTEIKNAKTATCTEKGYTGDTYCKGCNAKLYDGKDIPAAGHTGGTANCHAKAVCEVCKQEYGTVDATKHDGGTEVKNAKTATCTEKGYTGDTYCKGCGDKLSDGADIPAAGHDWAAATCTTPKTCKVCKVTEGDSLGHTGGTANCHAKAVCEVCKQEYGTVDATKHDGGTEIKNAKAATCTEKGYTGDTYCKGCNAKLADGKDIPAAGHKLKHVPAKKPTSFVAGNIEYWYCTVCGKYFRDAAATQEITKESTVTHKESAPIQDNKTIKSSKTGDPGVMLYAGMAVLSLTGCAWLRRKEK